MLTLISTFRYPGTPHWLAVIRRAGRVSQSTCAVHPNIHPNTIFNLNTAFAPLTTTSHTRKKNEQTNELTLGRAVIPRR